MRLCILAAFVGLLFGVIGALVVITENNYAERRRAAFIATCAQSTPPARCSVLWTMAR